MLNCWSSSTVAEMALNTSILFPRQPPTDFALRFSSSFSHLPSQEKEKEKQGGFANSQGLFLARKDGCDPL
jgi:hypothetical protein